MRPSTLFRSALAAITAELVAEGFGSLRELRTWQGRFAEAFGAMPVGELEPAVVVAWLRLEASRDRAPKTMRKALWLLRKVLDRCVLAGALKRNPARDLPTDVVPRNRVRDPGRSAVEVLAPSEVRAVLEADLPENFLALLALLVLAGLRFGEGAEVRWGDFALREPRAQLTISRQWHTKDRVVRETKADSVRRVPVHPALERALARAYAWHERTFRRSPSPSDLVAPWIDVEHRVLHWREQTALAWWHRGAAALGLRRTRLHGLRHTFISTLINAGARENVVFALTHTLSSGRKDARTYVHYSWPTLCRAVDRFDLDACASLEHP